MTRWTLPAFRTLGRTCKGWVYPLLPRGISGFHAKRRKGLFYRCCDAGVLECQREQDRIFWENYLHPETGGTFWEVGAGDGVVGSHTLGLELRHAWHGSLWEPRAKPRQKAQTRRRCQIHDVGDPLAMTESTDLVAIHRPWEFPRLWESLRVRRLRPRWVIVENPEPDDCWARVLEGAGYRLKLFFHDDEYYELRS
jgi:hypothetical protein